MGDPWGHGGSHATQGCWGAAPRGQGRGAARLRATCDRTPPQAFSEYQVQQMTATFVDQFGFNDEEFADQDDSVK